MPSILVVDDDPDNFDVIETFLSEQDYELHYMANGLEAIASLNIFQPDLILLDVMMPQLDGFEVCQRIKSIPEWQAVPIIMVTALASKQDLARCLEIGADDFITKPVNKIELIARIRSMLRIYEQHKQLNNFNNQLETIVQERTAQLQTMIWEDSLTHLPSRAKLLQELSQKLTSSVSSSLAIAYLDCDQFNLVNGAFGYQVGNQLLQAIAHRLKSYLSAGDMLARIGEDEFCFLLYNTSNQTILESWLQKVLYSFEQAFEVANYEIFISVCIGIALGSSDYVNAEAMVQAADTALYKAKRQGKNSYKIFDHQLYVATLARITLENALKRAIDYDQFVNYYQPIVRLDNLTMVGVEALVRWQHPERGLVSPNEFIPCMEETGLIVKLGIIVLRKACEQWLIWQKQGLTDLTISVNLSVRQFASSTLLADIDQVLAETKMNPACLKLEITESAIMTNAEAAITLMKELRSRQIKISIDDFGTGYSSLGYLHRFPIDVLKIDRSFVNQMEIRNRNYQVVETIMNLSHQLDLAVIAEGIETEHQLQLLHKLGCEFGQGYLFSQPRLSTDLINYNCRVA